MSSAAGLKSSLGGSSDEPGTERRKIRVPVSGDSPLWLVIVAGVFVLAELSPGLLRMPLGADEITYIAQTSTRVSQVILPPVHGRGAAVLAAPVTLLTTSLLILRLWMALLSGIGLFLALFAWRGLRPAWVLAVAGFILGSLGIAQLSGVQVMPDWWVALGAIAMTGLFLQAVTGRMRRRVVLPLLAAVTFFLVMQRPQDTAFLLAPVIAAALLIPAWRNRGVLAAFGIGLVAGAAEWLGESYAWYGGPISRLHMMHQEPPKFALYFTLPYQLRVLNGPWYCRPGQCTGWDYPGLSLWWLTFLALVVAGVLAARRTGRLLPSLVPIAAAASALAAYTLFVPYAAPRYLLPSIALLTLPAADGIAWLVSTPRWRTAAILGVCAFLLVGVVTQQVVARSETRGQDAVRAAFIRKADRLLYRFGTRPPCIVASPSVAYYIGCAAPWTGEHLSQVLAQAPGGPAAWRLLPGTGTPVYLKKLSAADGEISG